MSEKTREDGRACNELRPITITRGWSLNAEGSALIEFGNTRVLCTASFTEGVPRWLKGEGKGWVSAEYAMLPRATGTRSSRESVKGKIGGRTHEISRLIGRSLRAVIVWMPLEKTPLCLTATYSRQMGAPAPPPLPGHMWRSLTPLGGLKRTA